MIAAGRGIPAGSAAESWARVEDVILRAFDFGGVAMSFLDIHGGFRAVNQAMCDLVGYSREELLSRHFRDITHADDLDTSAAAMQAVLTGETSGYQREKRYRHRLGHTVWGLLTITVVRDEAGQPRGLVTQVQNITERRRSAEALQVLAGGAGPGTDIFDVAARAVHAAGRYRWIGIGLVSPTDERVHAATFWESGRPAGPISYSLEGLPCRSVYRQPPGAQPRHVLVTDLQEHDWPGLAGFRAAGARSFRGELILGSGGNAVGHVFAYSDRQEVDSPEIAAFFRIVAQRLGAEYARVEAERALRDSEARYRSVVESQTELVCRFLANGTLTFVNNSYSRFFGGAHFPVGSVFFDSFPASERAAARMAIADVLAGKPVLTLEHRMTTPDASSRWVQWTVRMLPPR